MPAPQRLTQKFSLFKKKSLALLHEEKFQPQQKRQSLEDKNCSCPEGLWEGHEPGGGADREISHFCVVRLLNMLALHCLWAPPDHTDFPNTNREYWIRIPPLHHPFHFTACPCTRTQAPCFFALTETWKERKLRNWWRRPVWKKAGGTGVIKWYWVHIEWLISMGESGGGKIDRWLERWGGGANSKYFRSLTRKASPRSQFI